MNKEDLTDIIIEAIEILLNHILYTREVYPHSIFRKRRAYNTPIFVSIYPPLNTYIGKVLISAKELLKNDQLAAVELVLFQKEDQANERYRFFLAGISDNIDANENYDEHLLEFEEKLRCSIWKIAERLNSTKKLENDVQFKLLLETTQHGFLKLSQNSHHQEFPFVRCQKDQTPNKNLFILPLTEVSTIGLHMVAEIAG